MSKGQKGLVLGIVYGLFTFAVTCTACVAASLDAMTTISWSALMGVLIGSLAGISLWRI